jgi:hypothetical protein
MIVIPSPKNFSSRGTFLSNWPLLRLIFKRFEWPYSPVPSYNSPLYKIKPCVNDDVSCGYVLTIEYPMGFGLLSAVVVGSVVVSGLLQAAKSVKTKMTIRFFFIPYLLYRGPGLQK